MGRPPGPIEYVLVPTSTLTPERRSRIDDVLAANSFLADLGMLFSEAGFELAIVGGPVRDAVLGRPGNDWDFATSARPDDIERIAAGWADAIWDVGREFGTIGLRHGDHQLEITTYRSDAYDTASRKPQVQFGDSLEGDLSRRDFAVNAMAIRLP